MHNHDSSSENWRGRIALMVAHCAGMVDLVALPVWMGALIARYGLPPQQAGTLVTLFLLGYAAMAAIMLAAAATSALLFPGRAGRAQAAASAGTRDLAQAGSGVGGSLGAADAPPISSAVWLAALGIGCMGLLQAMMFSFLERIGADRGYSATAVTGVLIALGIVNLFPAPLAALLEKRWPARYMVLAGPVVQASLALAIANSSTFASYAGAAAVFAAVMIFTHTFAFGLVAQLDPAGRALSATPAMLMVGAAIGPVLGGTLVQHAGYTTLGTAAVLIATVAVLCFARAGQRYILRSLQ